MKKKYFIGLALIIFLLGNAPHAGAFFLGDLLTEIIKPFSSSPDASFSLDSKIELSDDINNNGKIDSGDSVIFLYEINNPSDTQYSFLSLNTGLDRSSIHFIRNIKGTMSLSDSNKTIIIPNLSILPGETKIISFEATINYFTGADISLSTNPELITQDKKQLLKSEKRTFKVKALKDEIDGMIEARKK